MQHQDNTVWHYSPYCVQRYTPRRQLGRPQCMNLGLCASWRGLCHISPLQRHRPSLGLESFLWDSSIRWTLKSWMTETEWEVGGRRRGPGRVKAQVNISRYAVTWLSSRDRIAYFPFWWLRFTPTTRVTSTSQVWGSSTKIQGSRQYVDHKDFKWKYCCAEGMKSIVRMLYISKLHFPLVRQVLWVPNLLGCIIILKPLFSGRSRGEGVCGCCEAWWLMLRRCCLQWRRI